MRWRWSGGVGGRLAEEEQVEWKPRRRERKAPFEALPDPYGRRFCLGFVEMLPCLLLGGLVSVRSAWLREWEADKEWWRRGLASERRQRPKARQKKESMGF